MHPIPVFVVNLKKRVERKAHIQKEFYQRDEFDVTIIEAQEHRIGALGLWHTVKSILNKAINSPEDYIVICEDDHQFSEHYSKELLIDSIDEAKMRKADLLGGGVAWFNSALPVSEHIFWVEKFSGFQFTVIFRQFFTTILNVDLDDGTNFRKNDTVDLKLSSLTANKFFIYPFISSQKEFGYSDVTIMNNEKGRVERLFMNTLNKAKIVKYYSDHYSGNANNTLVNGDTGSNKDMILPVYIINLPGRTQEFREVEQQFRGKNEFILTMTEACQQENAALSLWSGIRKIVGMAVEKKEDVIIFCEDTHEFSEHYSKEPFFQDIMEAYCQGAEILCGGITGFGMAIPVAKNRIWVNSFSGTQFLVLYKSIFQKILDWEYDGNAALDETLSRVSRHKMTVFPFISIKDTRPGSFGTAENRLELVRRVHDKFLPAFEAEGNVWTRSLPELIKEINIAENNDRFFVSPISFKERLYDRQAGRIESRIIALVPFYTPGDNIEDCLTSIVKQNYTNSSLMSYPGVTKQTASGLASPLANILRALTENAFGDEDIIAIIDGNDCLLHNQVFNEVNDMYFSANCLVTYGQYLLGNGQMGDCRPYSREEFQHLRSQAWRVSHLKTFKYKVFTAFLQQDPIAGTYKNNKGQFHQLSYDIALMTPLLEIAGFENIYFNSAPVYGYRGYGERGGSSNSQLQPVRPEEVLGKHPFMRICFDKPSLLLKLGKPIR